MMTCEKGCEGNQKIKTLSTKMENATHLVSCFSEVALPRLRALGFLRRRLVLGYLRLHPTRHLGQMSFSGRGVLFGGGGGGGAGAGRARARRRARGRRGGAGASEVTYIYDHRRTDVTSYSDRPAGSRLGASRWPWLCSFVLSPRMSPRRRSDHRPCERECACASARIAHTHPRALSSLPLQLPLLRAGP